MAYTPRVPSESPPTPLFIHLSTHRFSPAAVLPHNHLSIPLSTHPSTHLSIHLSIHPCIHPPIRPSTHLSDDPLFCLFTHSFSLHPLAHLSLRPSSPTPSPRATPHLGSGLSCQSPEMTQAWEGLSDSHHHTEIADITAVAFPGHPSALVLDFLSQEVLPPVCIFHIFILNNGDPRD